jgi:hypothetical protein
MFDEANPNNDTITVLESMPFGVEDISLAWVEATQARND